MGTKRSRTRPIPELVDWCEKHGVGAVTFLHLKTGLTYAAVHRIVRGRAQPKPETAKKIARATGGEVSAAALLGLKAA